jgi:hypothetical protein
MVALIETLDWRTDIVTRPFDGEQASPSPLDDRLMTAAYVVEAGWYFTACDLLAGPPSPLTAWPATSPP